MTTTKNFHDEQARALLSVKMIEEYSAQIAAFAAKARAHIEAGKPINAGLLSRTIRDLERAALTTEGAR